MTTKERDQLEVIVTHLIQAQIAVGKDKSWGLALERMADAADAIHELLDAKPRAKKGKPTTLKPHPGAVMSINYSDPK
jgi:hypothetical protein